MADTLRRASDDTEVTERRVETVERGDGGVSMLQKLVNVLAMLLLGMLAIRMLLSLLGANRSNSFADFTYDLTNPFVAPFRNLFGIDTEIGVGRFEIETLVAILVYGLLAWAILRLLDVPRADRTV